MKITLDLTRQQAESLASVLHNRAAAFPVAQQLAATIRSVLQDAEEGAAEAQPEPVPAPKPKAKPRPVKPTTGATSAHFPLKPHKPLK